jgi:histidinol phosphatase-like enzyme
MVFRLQYRPSTIDKCLSIYHVPFWCQYTKPSIKLAKSHIQDNMQEFMIPIKVGSKVDIVWICKHFSISKHHRRMCDKSRYQLINWILEAFCKPRNMWNKNPSNHKVWKRRESLRFNYINKRIRIFQRPPSQRLEQNGYQMYFMSCISSYQIINQT